MQKVLLICSGILAICIASCVKYTNLPAYNPPVKTNFSVTSLNHTKDTVNVGDTIYLTAAGTVYDTTQRISTYLTSSYTAAGASTVATFYSATAPDTLKNRVVSPGTAPLSNWTSTITLIGATNVPHKTKLTIAANFLYNLTLSSEAGGKTDCHRRGDQE